MLNTPVRSYTEKGAGSIDDDTSINLADFAGERDAFLSHLLNNPQFMSGQSIGQLVT